MRSAVWLATLKKCYKIADLLVRSGANVTEPLGRSRTFDEDATLLHLAAESGKLHRVRLLLRHGACVDARDSRGKTALHYAAARDHAEVCDLLISQGADVNSKDRYGLSILHIAVLKRGLNATRLLLTRGADLEATDERGWNALHIAVLVESIRLAEMLLWNGISVDVRDMLMWTPLHFALNSSKEQMIQLLLDYGADVNTKSKDGHFPLYYAVATDNPTIVKLLLRKGADINEKMNDGDTTLHVACRRGLDNVVDILLDFQADVNAKNKLGEIALLSINQQEHNSTARIVIKHIAKLVVKSAFVIEDNCRAIRVIEDFQRFYEECLEEIAKMKLQKVEENCSASYYYIFSKNQETLASLAKNKDLVVAFESNDYCERFPVYAKDLTMKFNNAKRRRNFMFSVESCLSSILSSYVPNVVIQNIASYLNYDDFNIYDVV